MTGPRWLAWPFLALGLLLITAVPAAAQSPVSDDEVNEVARELYCPTCENTPLDVCPTQTCADWREEIRTQLEAGRSEQEIRSYFAERYGTKVLAEPPQRGFHLIVWLLPIVAVIIGGLFFNYYLRRISRPLDIQPVPDVDHEHNGDGPAPDDYVARIERELQEKGS